MKPSQVGLLVLTGLNWSLHLAKQEFIQASLPI